MRTAFVNDAAAILLAARKDRIPIARLVDDAGLQSFEEAHAVQDKLVRDSGGAGSWKIGKITAANPSPYAPILATDVLTSPATYAMGDVQAVGIEGEIAFILGVDLPAAKTPFTREAILGAVESAHVAIEILTSRYVDPAVMPMVAHVADCIGNCGLLIGEALLNWRTDDLVAPGLSACVDGKAKGLSGANGGGDPIDLALSLANLCAARGIHLRAGLAITTGTTTGLIFAPAGSLVTIERDGRVLASLTLCSGS